MSTEGDEKVVEQITKQLNKLIDVVMVSDLSDSQHIEKELMLVKFTEDSFPKETFEESSIVSNSDGVINVQVVGTSLELDELITTLDSSKPIEIVRSGVLGISSNKDILSIEN
jgi:acetolactate synthase-1/3 small subunit